jgi:hypothetical protein
MEDTYEFLCLSCPDISSAWADYQTINDLRPYCHSCHLNMVPNLNSFRDLSNAKMQDIWITPDLAITWLDNGFASFRAEMSEATIQNYTNLMKSDRWVDATEKMGGYWCPIIRIDHTLMLGFNRLQACLNANRAFTNTVIEVV